MPLQSEFSGVTAALRRMSHCRIKQVADLHSSHHGYLFVKSWTSILYRSRWWFRLCVGNVYLKQFMSFMIQCDLRNIFETGRSTTKCWEASTKTSSMKSFNSRCWNWGMNLTWSWRDKFDKLKNWTTPFDDSLPLFGEASQGCGGRRFGEHPCYRWLWHTTTHRPRSAATHVEGVLDYRVRFRAHGYQWRTQKSHEIRDASRPTSSSCKIIHCGVLKLSDPSLMNCATTPQLPNVSKCANLRRSTELTLTVINA